MPKWFASERIGSVLRLEKVLGRVDPLGLAGAMVQVGTRTATNALPRRVAGLGVEMAKVAVGRSSIAPDPKDWRFENRAWKENPLFHRLCQSYLAWTRTALDLVDDAQLRLAHGRAGQAGDHPLHGGPGADQRPPSQPRRRRARLRDRAGAAW